ncbi:MAG: chromate transporter [Bacillota bacterium]
MMLLKLFITFIKVGAFSFGGGYGVIAFIQREVIEINHWLSNEDFANVVAIAEMTPGPIAVNSSTFVGYKLGGVLGSTVGTIGVVLVPFLLTLIAAVYFQKFKHFVQLNWILRGIKPAVIGLIAASCIKIAKISFVDLTSVIIGLLVFGSVYKLKLNPILALLFSGVLGVLLYGFM